MTKSIFILVLLLCNVAYTESYSGQATINGKKQQFAVKVQNGKVTIQCGETTIENIVLDIESVGFRGKNIIYSVKGIKNLEKIITKNIVKYPKIPNVNKTKKVNEKTGVTEETLVQPIITDHYVYVKNGDEIIKKLCEIIGYEVNGLYYKSFMKTVFE